VQAHFAAWRHEPTVDRIASAAENEFPDVQQVREDGTGDPEAPILPGVQLENRTGDPGRFVCASGSRFSPIPVCVEFCPTLKARKLAAIRGDASGVAHSPAREWFGHGGSTAWIESGTGK